MTITIIDASVAIKWFVAGEPSIDVAHRVLDDIKTRPDIFAVPELFFNEMLHVLCRLVPDQKLIKGCLHLVQVLGWQRLDNGSDVLDLAVTLAKEHGISGYDAIYAANAKLMHGIWLTADERAHAKIRQLKISRVL